MSTKRSQQNKDFDEQADKINVEILDPETILQMTGDEAKAHLISLMGQVEDLVCKLKAARELVNILRREKDNLKEKAERDKSERFGRTSETSKSLGVDGQSSDSDADNSKNTGNTADASTDKKGEQAGEDKKDGEKDDSEEKPADRDPSLLTDEAQSKVHLPENSHTQASLDEMQKAKKQKNGKPRRKSGCMDRQVENLPDMDQYIEVSDEELQKVFGGAKYRILPDGQNQTTRRVIVIPKIIMLLKIHRRTYVSDEMIVHAAVKQHLTGFVFPRSFCSSSLLTDAINGRVVEGLSVYQLCRDYRRMGLIIAEATIESWINRAVDEIFELVWMRMKQFLLTNHYIQADETHLCVRSISSSCQIWVFLTSEKCDAEHRIIIYYYSPSRGEQVLEDFFGKDAGGFVLITDAYQVYDKFVSRHKDVKLQNCLTHCRRGFADVIKGMSGFDKLTEEDQNRILAVIFLKIFTAIYYEEGLLSEKPPQERLEGRREKIRPLIKELFDLAHSFDPKEVDQGSLLAKALNYTLNHEEHFKLFLEDGNIPIDNGESERMILRLAVARRRFKMIGSERGARSMACCFSICETARANGADPRSYFQFLIERVPELRQKNQQKWGKLDPDLSFLDCVMPWSEEYKTYARQLAQDQLDMSRQMLRNGVIVEHVSGVIARRKKTG